MAFGAFATAAPVESVVRRRSKVALLLLLPGIAYLALFFLVPLVSLVLTSFQTKTPGTDLGVYEYAFQWQNYVTVVSNAGGNYLVLYEVFMATPPTSPDSVTAQPRMTGNRGFIGKTVGANNLTVAEYLTGVSSGAYGWQEFNWFSGGGDLKLQCAKDSGSSCNFETINITIARLGDSLSF